MDHLHHTYSFPSHTGNGTIFVQSLAPADPTAIKGVIQIVHGMAEHTDRYLEAAAYFCDAGYAVIMHDHAGHGKSVTKEEDQGFFGEKDGYKKLVDDISEVTKLAKKHFPGVKLILWGHSMGSFLSRNYLTTYKNNVDAAVICGTSGKNPGAAPGILIANTVAKIKGPRSKSQLINNIAFGSYNKRFKGNTGFEWLSANEENVKKYVADPKCGFLFSAAGYRDLFSVLKSVSGNDWYKEVPAHLPIYLIAGEEDPVGNYGKGVREVYEKLKATGHDRVSIKLYPGLRHEIHNERTRKEVYDDILAFAEKV